MKSVSIVFLISLGALGVVLAGGNLNPNKCGNASIDMMIDKIDLIEQPNRVYKQSNGSIMTLSPSKRELLAVIPTRYLGDLLGFARHFSNCPAKIFIDDREIEERIVSNLLPLSSVGIVDKFVSLRVDKSFNLSSKRPLLMRIISERSYNGAIK